MNIKYNKLKNPRHRFQLIVSIIIILILAITGIYLLIPSHAANPSAVVVASNGTFSGPAGIVFNSSATNQRAAQFGSRDGTNCLPDPSATIAALPIGAVWNGGGACYLMPLGVEVTQPVTLENATFVNPSTIPNTAYGGLNPLVRVKDTNNVTLSNLNLEGGHTDTGYHGTLVGQAGIDVKASANVTIDNVSTLNTFGDGLTLVSNQPKDRNADINVLVNNLNITNAGRQGVTVAEVQGGTFNNVNIISSADTGWDFESDIVDVGSGDVVVNGVNGDKGVHLGEAINGPITFNNNDFSGHVTLEFQAAASGQPVTFNGGNILLPASDNGVPQGGITVNGPGNLTFNNVTFGRQASNQPPSGPFYYVSAGAKLTFNKSPVSPPAGLNDGTATVTVIN